MMSNSSHEEILKNLTAEEKALALSILKELEDKGESKTLTDLIYNDYEEIPVTIEEFLRNPTYLGAGLINTEGKFTVFPYWMDVLKKLFPTNIDTAYNTLILSGAIGLGKSFVAVIAILYMLYRMLCLKDPYLHYGLQPIDKITFSFINITLDAAKGVAWDKCQQLLQSSPWFMSKGKVDKKDIPEWQPSKNIELLFGSLPRHIIGRAVFCNFCLDGDTVISTTDGDIKIKELVDKDIKVSTMKDNDIIVSDVCTVKPTIITNDEYRITLEDGSIIECTPNHRFMLVDGSYKEAQDLTENDDIMNFIPFGYIYKTTNIKNGKVYIGKRQKSHFDESYWGSGTYLKRVIKKYGVEVFKREILCWCKSHAEMCDKEKYFIKQYDSTNKKCGYNITHGGDGTTGAKHTREWKLKHSGSGNGRYGKEVSSTTREKIGKANKGRNAGVKNPKKGRPGVKKPTNFGEKIRKANIGKTIPEETRKKISDAIKNSRWCNNGIINIKISAQESLPEGFQYGQIVTEERKELLRELLKQNQKSYGDKNGMLGKKHSEKSRKLMSEHRKERTASNKRKVICIETNKIYDSIKLAQIDTNIWHIGDCCRGKIKTAGKYHWRFIDENK